MNQDRRKLIVREIDHWRRSKLLPDQYCDFLLNLYADPTENLAYKPATYSFGKAFQTVQKATGKQWLFTFGTFTFISFVVLYFSRFHPAMQIAILAGFVIALLTMGNRFRRQNEAMGVITINIGMILLLGGSLYLLELHDLTRWGWYATVFGFSSVFWITYGMWKRIILLQLCGWICVLLLYGWLLSEFTISNKWYEIQLYWLPLAILFGWSSWFVHRWFKPVSAVLFISCVISWFMPELYTLVIIGDHGWLQLQLLLKFACGGALLFTLRKQWMVWVV